MTDKYYRIYSFHSGTCTKTRLHRTHITPGGQQISCSMGLNHKLTKDLEEAMILFIGHMEIARVRDNERTRSGVCLPQSQYGMFELGISWKRLVAITTWNGDIVRLDTGDTIKIP